MGWQPLSRRETGDSDYGALHEGVPPWLRTTLLDWLAPFFKFANYSGEVVANRNRIREIERKLRFDLTGVSYYELELKLVERLASDETLLVDAVEYQRRRGSEMAGHERLPRRAVTRRVLMRSSRGPRLPPASGFEGGCPLRDRPACRSERTGEQCGRTGIEFSVGSTRSSS